MEGSTEEGHARDWKLEKRRRKTESIGGKWSEWQTLQLYGNKAVKKKKKKKTQDMHVPTNQ